MSVKAVFLDRDGTINVDTGYVGDPNSVELLPYVGESLHKLAKEYNFLLVVISNQSGVARGLFSSSQVEEVNAKVNALLEPFNTQIDHFYYCPHHPDFSNPAECNCRKPSPQMVFLAAEELNIDLSNSYFIGDKISDIECGNNAGVKTVLMKTNLYDNEIIKLKNNIKSTTFVAADFREVCEFIIKDISEDSV